MLRPLPACRARPLQLFLCTPLLRRPLPQCKTFATGSKCGTLGYKAYCARCNAPSAPNKCVECNGSRGLVGDACTIPCKRVYGIGCRKCNATACTKKDPAYANGRR